MIRQTISEWPFITSVGFGYTLYYIVTSVNTMSGSDVYLIGVFTILAYIYVEGGFGGFDNE